MLPTVYNDLLSGINEAGESMGKPSEKALPVSIAASTVLLSGLRKARRALSQDTAGQTEPLFG